MGTTIVTEAATPLPRGPQITLGASGGSMQAVERITGSLVPVSELQQIAVDGVPRRVEAGVYTAGVHFAAFLEAAVQRFGPFLPADDPLLVLAQLIEGEIAGVLVPPAGSAILHQLPIIVGQVQTYLQSTNFSPSSAAGKAIMAHLEQLVEAEAATPLPRGPQITVGSSGGSIKVAGV